MSNKFVSETKWFRLSFFQLRYCVMYLILEWIQYQYCCLCFLPILIAKCLRQLPGGVAPLDCCCMTSRDVARGVTGGYFQNGRNCKVLEGNPDIFICCVRIPSATTDAPGRATNNITRLHVSARQKTGTMSVSIGDKIEVSSFVRLTPTS